MSFPTDSGEKNLFRSHFRAASPILKSEEPDLIMEIQEDIPVESIRQMTSEIEDLTDIARRDSFSSISSCGQRQQFKTALVNLQDTLFGEREKTPKKIMDPTVSHTGDSDHEFEHLDAPDPAELAQYQSGKLTMSDQETSPVHVPQEQGLGNYLEEAKQKGQDFVEDVQQKTHDFLDEIKNQNFFENVQKEENLLVDLSPPEPQENIPKVIDDFFSQPPPQENQQFPGDPSPDIVDNVDEVLPEPIRHSPLTEERKQIEEGIQSAVNDTQNEVEAVLGALRSGSPPPVPEQNSPSGDSGRDTLAGLIGEHHESEPQIPVSDSLSGMREISPDEQTFDRRGPLTIPEKFPNFESKILNDIPSVPPSRNFEEDFEQIPEQHSHFDDLPARPPTPPKDLSDEDVQPPSIDLGPPSHVHEKSSDHGLKPILRHHSGLGPWIDFKTIDPKG